MISPLFPHIKYNAAHSLDNEIINLLIDKGAALDGHTVMFLISVCPFLPAFSFLILHSFKHSLFPAEAGDLFNTESC